MTNAAGAHAPVVSVVIPAYNASSYIAETLDSVFAQQFRDFEVLVVNDGSPDTPALEAALAPYRHRIEYLVRENGGPSAARNTAIRRAHGSLVAFIDGDDRWMPDCLADQVARATADPSAAVLHGDAEIIGDPVYAGTTLRQHNGSEGQVDFLGLITERCVITTSCSMVRRDVLLDVGMFDEALRRSEDFDLWLRIARRSLRFDTTAKVLGQYRRNGTGTSSNEDVMADAIIAVLDKCERTMTLTPPEREALERRRARERAVKQLLEGKRALREGDYARAQRALRAANTVMRSRKLSLVVNGLSLAPGVVARLYNLRTGRQR
ncbi:MAG TPA: glycosyltransferase family A protein [Gemmatimonadaceae bacterium]|jgi:glycosyltransferase involved in cell wall biosynthesis|nr:glycosyltransferase family A protein [Gemmatimonadaceae bacterium]